MSVPEHKTCSRCQGNFPATAEFFQKDKSRKSGLIASCKACTASMRQERVRKRGEGRTHCRNGHLYDGSLNRRGHRYCRMCKIKSPLTVMGGLPRFRADDFLNDELKKLLSYDPETGFLHWLVFRNEKVRAGDRAGGRAPRGLIVCVKYKSLMAHRIAWFLHYGVRPSGIIDHINGDAFDNRISNLREATSIQNRANSHANAAKISCKYKGVYFDKRAKRKPWYACIQTGNVEKYLGSFETPEQASAAYEAAAAKRYGQYSFHISRKVLNPRPAGGVQPHPSGCKSATMQGL